MKRYCYMLCLLFCFCSPDERNNPLDAHGTAWNPPVYAGFNHSVNINDTIEIPIVLERGNEIRRVIFYDNHNFSDTAYGDIWKTAFNTHGEKIFYAVVIDEHRLRSVPVSCTITVTLDPPVVTAMPDTAVKIYDTLLITAHGEDTNPSGYVVSYHWALDGVNYADTTDSGSISTLFPDTGSYVVRVKVLDDDGIFSEPDSAVVTVLVDTFTVSFESNGGSGVDHQKVSYNAPIILPSNPLREGYDFDGWYENEDLTEQWDFSADKVIEDITLYADWEIVNYTITYELYGGDNYQGNPEFYTIEALTVTFEEPTRTSHTFYGWYTDEEFTEEITGIISGSTGDITVYAKWDFNVYTVAFNSNDGSAVDTQDVTHGNLAPEPDVPTRSGFLFDGWFSDENFEAAWDFESDTVISDIIIYAKWLEIFAVTFATNGGSTVAELPVVEGDLVTEPEAPTREGYAFLEWYRDEDLTIAWDFAYDYVTKDTTLYADWELINYTISYILNGGENHQDNPEYYTIYSPTIILQDPPLKTGFTFERWYEDAEFNNAITEITSGSTGDITVYAKWDFNVYTVTFNSNEGSSVDTQDVGHGSLATEPDDPTLAGFVFDGWYSDENFQSAWDFESDTVVSDIILYSKWLQIFTVTFATNGGSTVAEQPVVEGDLVTEPEPPTLEGYDFEGWYRDEDLTIAWNFGNDYVTKDTTLYADWELINYTISYILNGGENHQDNPEYYTIYSPTIILQDPPIRTGFTFNGWYEDAEFNNAITEIISGSTGNITAYAKWTINQYTITYYLNGGENHPNNPDSFTVSETITFEEATRTGYTFEGWYEDPWFNTVITEIPEGSTGNVNVHARWTPNEYTVTFNPQGGSAPDPLSRQVSYSMPYGSLATTSWSGYTFLGWWTGEGGTGIKITTGSIVNISNNHTLYAHWGVVDGDGNVYTTVIIGSQEWTVENLRTTRYSCGTPIPHITDENEWSNLSSPGYCWYNNDSSQGHGTLYNWYTVADTNSKNIAPEGWRVPSGQDWSRLRNYLIDNCYTWTAPNCGLHPSEVAKSLASDGGEWWGSTTTGHLGHEQESNNRTGFTALPGGKRNQVGVDDFTESGSLGYWWGSSTAVGTNKGFFAVLYSRHPTLRLADHIHYLDKGNGLSVRLVRDVD